MKCEICQRSGENSFFEKHHLTPAQGKKDSDVITVCHQCGDQLHLLFDNYELRKELNTLSAIQSHEKIQAYIKFIRKHPIDTHITVKKKKRKL